MKKFKVDSIVRFVVAVFFIGLISGIAFYFATTPDTKDFIESFIETVQNTHQNTFLPNFISISIVFVLSISIIGLPAACFYIFYEGLSIGYTFAVFAGLYSIKGILFYSLFILVSKLIFILILLYLTIISIKYVLKFIDSITNKSKEGLSKAIVLYFYRFIIVIGISLINSLVIYFISNELVKIFLKLIV